MHVKKKRRGGAEVPCPLSTLLHITTKTLGLSFTNLNLKFKRRARQKINVGGARRFQVRLILRPKPYVHRLLTSTLGSKGVGRARRLHVGFRLTFYLPSTKMGHRGLITTQAVRSIGGVEV